MTETFLAWQRAGMSTLAGETYAEGRMKGELVVTLNDGAARDGSAPFLFAGPQDVQSLQAGVIVGRKPSPGTQDAETTRVAHIELSDPGLPWRYTPFPNEHAGVWPWLVLVVGRTGEEVIVEGPTVRILNSALKEHPLEMSSGWAHVHEIPGATIARILSPYELEKDKAYTAVLVPSIFPGSGANPPQFAWNAFTPEVTLPCHDHWSFRTRDDTDDFRSIAQRLEPLSAAEDEALRAAGFGLASITVRGRGDPVLHLGGALSTVDKPPTEPLTDADGVAEEVEKLAALSEIRGRWVLGLPRYDEPWTAPYTPVPDEGWRRQLRVDPRHRGTAGLGAWAAIAWQERIAEGAARQAGELAVLAERVRNLSLGLHAARRLWARRLPSDPVQAFAVVGPMLARLPVDGGSVALDRLAGRTSRLVPALFSSGARRMLRPRNALGRVARPGATSLPALIEAAATRCVPQPEQLPGQRELAEVAADPAQRERAAGTLRQEGGAFLEQALQPMPDETREPIRGLLNVLEEFSDELMGLLERKPVENPCAPIADLAALATSVLDGINPHVARPVAVGRMLDGITGIRQPELAEPDLALELNIPLWSFLQQESPDWLLPGGSEMPIDRVHAISTNPEFVDAFLLGANHRALGELRWRNLPLVTGWTPLRRFWQRISTDGSGPDTDIRPVLDILTPPSPGDPIWTDTSDLGAPTHAVGIGAQLVVILHTELFRRYPATIVSLMKNPGGTATWQDDVDQIKEPRIWPNMTGSLHPELVFFGFPTPPDAGRDHWLVLEEPPPGFRFKVPVGKEKIIKNAAIYATTTLNPPVRAFFGKLLPQ